MTLATNDEYAIGALVLGNSLRVVHTQRSLAVLTTSMVSSAMSERLKTVFDLVKEVDLLDTSDASHLELLSRPELGVTLTKINCWRLTQFNKCVFLDADTLVLRNIDDLFERAELSAAPDVGWPDCFNSGVFVFQPSEKTYNDLLCLMNSQGSFDGGDQGLLNSFFSDWATKDIQKHLPFVYNVVTQTFYSYLPALKQFGKEVRVVHFIGSQKPWCVGSESVPQTNDEDTSAESSDGGQFIRYWWRIFREKVQPLFQLNVKAADRTDMTSTNAKDVPQKDVQISHEQPAEDAKLGDPNRQYEWEKGAIDYMGMDSFENILKQLDEKINEQDLAKTKEFNKADPQLPK